MCKSPFCLTHSEYCDSFTAAGHLDFFLMPWDLSEILSRGQLWKWNCFNRCWRCCLRGLFWKSWPQVCLGIHQETVATVCHFSVCHSALLHMFECCGCYSFTVSSSSSWGLQGAELQPAIWVCLGLLLVRKRAAVCKQPPFPQHPHVVLFRDSPRGILQHNSAFSVFIAWSRKNAGGTKLPPPSPASASFQTSVSADTCHNYCFLAKLPQFHQCLSLPASGVGSANCNGDLSFLA